MKLSRCLLTFFLALILAVGPVLAPLSENAGRAVAGSSQNGSLLPDYSKYIKTFEKASKILRKIGPFKEYGPLFDKAIKYATKTNKIMGVVSSIVEMFFGGGNGSTDTPVTLVTIYDAIIDVQNTLNTVNKKLDRMAENILKLQISSQERERSTIARDECANLNLFSQLNCKPLDTYIEVYGDCLAAAFKEWYTTPAGRDRNADIVLLHAMIAADDGTSEQSLLMSNEDDPASVTETDTGINADPALTFTIPSSAFANLPSYKPGTAADNFRAAVSAYVKGEGLSSDMAELYAQEAYETLQYRLGCEVAQDRAIWSMNFSGIKTEFINFLNAAVSAHTGLDAQLQLIYNTYGFEGEAKELINYASDKLIAATSAYGMFVIDLLEKNNLTTEKELTSLMDQWSETVDVLETMREKALTGYDDYCYVTGTRLTAANAHVYSNNIQIFYLTKEHDLSSLYQIGFAGDSAFRVRITGPDNLFADNKLEYICGDSRNIADTVSTAMLIHIQQQQSDTYSSFADYLTGCNANTGSYIDPGKPLPIITNFTDTEEISSPAAGSEFKLTARTIRGSDYKDGQSYNVSDISKSKWNRFFRKSKAMGETVDITSGAFDTNAVIIAAFAYATGEEDLMGRWFPKNITNFETAGTKIVGTRTDYKPIFSSYYEASFDNSFYKDYNVLYRQPIKIKPSDNNNAGGNVHDPLQSYLASSRGWMQDAPGAEYEFAHNAVNQSRVQIVNDMGANVSERMNEYEALIRDAATRYGVRMPDSKGLASLKQQMEACWQDTWKMTNENTALLNYVPIELTELEMKDLVRHVINRTYAENDKGEIVEYTDEKLDLHLMDKKDMNLYLRVSPRVAVEVYDGAYRVFSCFDITPMIVAHSYVVKNGHVTMTEDIEQQIQMNEILTGNLEISIRIPVSKNSAGKVKVRHFDNWYTFLQDELLDGTVLSDNGSRYVELKGLLFGPFSVRNDYSPSKPVPIPKTGDSTNLPLIVLSLLCSLVCLTLMLRKKRSITL
ncbi:MAG: LPXTG cell wall anchor domain-containing protein [Clostridia bacterium]|nr:LPXTG cell wall anchor domain-containing protein [Clostridia bacterium]